ncbi:MAG: MATE family efflux transporter [Spirochaetia bacterium]|nr:MATE family efflux transporter [Spirochaetia bacterium]
MKDRMIDTPVSGLVLRLAVPSIITMLVSNLYNIVDTAFVGLLGTSASGAVGIVFGFMAIIQAFGFMFGQGGGSILSRSLGAGDKENASLHASAGFFGSMFWGFIIAVIGFIWLDPIVMILGSTPTIAPYAKTYISFILISAPFMCSSYTLNNFLRYEGKAKLGMIGMLSGAVLNMIGDPILMFGFKMGIYGAGLSTAISQFIGWFILFSMFRRGKTESVLSIRQALKASPAVMANIAATGFPSLLRQGLHSLTTVVLNAQCALYGDAAVAAMSIVSRLTFFTFSFALGVGQGFQPVSAYNYGAKRYSRIRQSYRFTIMAAECIIVVGVIVLIVFAPQLIRLLRDDAAVVAIGKRALRLQAAAYLLLPACMVTEMLMQSTGYRLGASLLSAFRSGLLFIPSILILSHFRGLAGIQEAQPLALILSAPITVPFAMFFFGRLPKEDG